MFSRKAIWLGAALGALSLMLAGCGGDNESAAPTASNPNPGAGSSAGGTGLTGAGATFPYPLYSKWFDAYHRAHADVTVNYQSIGSGGGIQQLKNRTVDFGASDAPLSDDEQKEMPAPVLHVPTVGGAVALVYNLPNAPAKLKLTPEAIAGIFLGTITKWNDPAIASANAGATLPDTSVAVAHRSDGSGTSYIFTNYLAAVSPEWKSKVGAGKSVQWPVGLGGKGSEGVTGLVKQTPGGIGYVELAYATQNNLTVARVRNAAGQFVDPTVESTTAAIAAAASALAKDVRAPIVNAGGKDVYPIAGLTYILLYQDQQNAAQGKATVHLLNWCIHDGQSQAAPLQYAPLPEILVKLNEVTLGRVTSGGSPLLSGGSSGSGSTGESSTTRTARRAAARPTPPPAPASNLNVAFPPV